MAKPPSQVIAHWVIDYISENKWILLSDICYDALKINMKSSNESELYEIIEENVVYIAEHLRDYRDQQIQDGETPLFEIDEEESPYIRSLKSDIGEFLKKIRKISPSEFEGLCAEILSKLGAVSDSIGKPHDGGVDFYAFDVPLFDKSLAIPKVTKAIIIGQAKHYSDRNLVKEKELREFVGGGILKLQEYRERRILNPLTPIVFAFWTTSDFHKSAKDYARNIGIWFMNGWSFARYVRELGINIE